MTVLISSSVFSQFTGCGVRWSSIGSLGKSQTMECVLLLPELETESHSTNTAPNPDLFYPLFLQIN